MTSSPYIPNVWEWLVNTTSVDSIIQAAGVVTLAVLFARDLIMTKGQHERRVADLVQHHGKEMKLSETSHELVLVEKDRAYNEMRESRDYYRGAHKTAEDRANQATEELREQGREFGQFTAQIMGGLNQAVKEVQDGTG